MSLNWKFLFFVFISYNCLSSQQTELPPKESIHTNNSAKRIKRTQFDEKCNNFQQREGIIPPNIPASEKKQIDDQLLKQRLQIANRYNGIITLLE